MAPKAAAKAAAKVEDEAKRKAAETKEEPAAKVAKKEEEPKEEKVEQEKDAAADKRPALKETVTFDAMDCTLNVLPTMQGKVLMSLSDGGMQFLIAGARANVGVKSGRYMFEAKVVEALNPAESAGNRGRVPLPRQLLRVGFSTAGSQLVLGETEDGVCFDAEGAFTADKTKKPICARFGKNQTVGVLLNLDEKSPNFNTVSLFHNGERYCEPQPLPDALKGKTLYPHVSYRNVSVQVSFGPQALSKLPFTCRTIQSAAAADVEVAKSQKTDKYEVVFPIAFPDEGTFDWLDTFMEKHPNHVELSDRTIIDWAAKSGLWKPKVSVKGSNDKPEFNYGLTAMDDMSVRRVLNAVAPLVPRNYVVMEVKENLTKADREANLKRFSNPAYKKIAKVVMGEPNNEFKGLVHSRILKEKKEKAETEWKAKKQERERKKQLEARQKQLADMRKKAEVQRKKAEAEKKKKAEEAAKKKKEEAAAKKKAEEAAKKAEAGEAAEEGEKEEETKEEAKEETEAVVEEPEEEEKEEEKKEEEDEEMEPPAVELSDEEKKVWFRPPGGQNDLTTQVMNSAFGKFTLPDKAEGFDAIQFEWDKESKANDYLRTWVLKQKLTSKMDDLKPSDWFKTKHDKFLKSVKEWQDKAKPFAKKKEEAAKKKKAAGEEEAEEEKADDLDIFSIENISDVGNGEPLFVNFTFEDWALLSLRYELFLLHAAFKHDAEDEERVGIHESNLVFYYNKYYHKQFTPKFYGKESNKDLVDFVKDTVTFDKDTNVLASNLEPDVDSLDIFVKLTEESRRERQRRIDAGDETARIKFNPMLNQVSKPAIAGAAKVAVAAVRAGPAGPAGWAGAAGKGAGWRPAGAWGKGAW